MRLQTKNLAAPSLRDSSDKNDLTFLQCRFYKISLLSINHRARKICRADRTRKIWPVSSPDGQSQGRPVSGLKLIHTHIRVLHVCKPRKTSFRANSIFDVSLTPEVEGSHDPPGSGLRLIHAHIRVRHALKPLLKRFGENSGFDVSLTSRNKQTDTQTNLLPLDPPYSRRNFIESNRPRIRAPRPRLPFGDVFRKNIIFSNISLIFGLLISHQVKPTSDSSSSTPITLW